MKVSDSDVRFVERGLAMGQLETFHRIKAELLALRVVADAAAKFIDADPKHGARETPWADLQHALARAGL
jgi:hypothetical protein